MPRLTTKVPSYRRHKASGQAVVTLDGKDFYLGQHGADESKAEYERLITEWLANNRQISRKHDWPTINQLIVAFWDHATVYYVKDGEPTGELQALRYSFRPLAKLYGETTTDNFGPRDLKAVRQRMIDQGLARSLINKRITRVRHVFKWGVENEMVPADVLHALQAVAPLKRGRCQVRESDPVKPAPEDHIDAIKPHVSHQVWTMIQLQLHTGMRPGEVVIMRPCDIDRSGKVWLYVPASHKTQHHGHERYIYFGPKAQMVVVPFLNRDSDAFMFSPAEAEEQRLAQRARARKTPLAHGNRRGTNRKRHPRRKPREQYDVGSFRRAIARGCDKAFPWPNLDGRKLKELTDDEKAELKAWKQKHNWHPHQLRHNAATYLRKEFGLEAARLVLGHKTAAITELYAELDHARAAEIMGKVG